MGKTPHEELAALRNENDELRTLLLEALRAMKEVELTLQRALDKGQGVGLSDYHQPDLERDQP